MSNLKLSKHTIIILGLLALSSLCAILYAANGSYLDENGILHEQFGFIPIAFLFFSLGILYLVIYLLKTYIPVLWAKYLKSKKFH